MGRRRKGPIGFAKHIDVRKARYPTENRPVVTTPVNSKERIRRLYGRRNGQRAPRSICLECPVVASCPPVCRGLDRAVHVLAQAVEHPAGASRLTHGDAAINASSRLHTLT